MRILLISLLLLAANLYYWTSIETLEALRLGAGAAQPLAVKDALLSLIALLLFIEAVFVLFRGAGESEGLWEREREEAQAELSVLREESVRLRTDLEESNSRASLAEEKSSKSQTECLALRKKLEEKQSRLLQAEQETSEHKAECLQRKTALEELKERLNESEQQATQAMRPEVVDAELLNLLSVLQEKGRLVDFLMDDIAPYTDEQVGSAARVVHQGCAPVLREYFTIEPMHQGTEGESLTLEKSFSSKRFRLIGSVSGEPPFTGTVLHRGWRASKVMLPRLSEPEQSGDDQGIIAPTEVQV